MNNSVAKETEAETAARDDDASCPSTNKKRSPRVHWANINMIRLTWVMLCLSLSLDRDGQLVIWAKNQYQRISGAACRSIQKINQRNDGKSSWYSRENSHRSASQVGRAAFAVRRIGSNLTQARGQCQWSKNISTSCFIGLIENGEFSDRFLEWLIDITLWIEGKMWWRWSSKIDCVLSRFERLVCWMLSVIAGGFLGVVSRRNRRRWSRHRWCFRLEWMTPALLVYWLNSLKREFIENDDRGGA